MSDFLKIMLSKTQGWPLQSVIQRRSQKVHMDPQKGYNKNIKRKHTTDGSRV